VWFWLGKLWHVAENSVPVLTVMVAAWAALEARRSAGAAAESVEITRSSVEQTMTSVRHQERAYVALKDIVGDRSIRENQTVNFAFVFKNVGNTPAYNVKFVVLVLMRDSVPTDDEIDSHLHLVHEVGVIAPTLDIRIEAASNEAGQPIALSAQGVADLNNRRMFFGIYGKITYRDVFGTSHDTRFAFHYNAEARQFHLAPSYNSMT
jgi:hypothetical protein